MKTFSDYILEKQNFVFGGKAGLTGKEYGTNKTFSELKKGDKLYFYSIDLQTNLCSKREYIFDNYGHPSYSKSETCMYFYEERGHSNKDSIGMTKERMSCSIEIANATSDYYRIFSTIDLTKEEAIEKVLELRRKGEKEMYESANFIFGGKSGLTGKEYGEGVKNFEELEPGDSIYVYELTFDGKRTRTNVFDYKKRRKSLDDDGVYFIGEWRNEKLKRSKSILLSKDCYERSAFSSYKTMVMSTYEMTDEELAKFVSNEDNEIRH